MYSQVYEWCAERKASKISSYSESSPKRNKTLTIIYVFFEVLTKTKKVAAAPDAHVFIN